MDQHSQKQAHHVVGHEVAHWLKSLKGTSDIVPVVLRIDKVEYQGARYKQGNSRDRYYVVGPLPRAYRRRPNGTCFRFEGDQTDWYIGCYWKGGDANQCHPFGDNFILMSWDVPDGTAIDRGLARPYDRHNISLA